MIKKGVEVEHTSNNWEEVKPTADDELHYIETHSLDEYGQWFLGINTDVAEDRKSKYVYPFGDFKVVQKSALMVVEEVAGKKHQHEIKDVAHQLLTKIVHGKRQ
jgi:hypothetical protein